MISSITHGNWLDYSSVIKCKTLTLAFLKKGCLSNSDAVGLKIKKGNLNYILLT